MCLPWHENLVNIHTISLSSCIHSFQWARKRDENASSSSHGPDSSPSPDWHNFPLSTFHARSTWIFHMPSADKLTHTHTLNVETAVNQFPTELLWNNTPTYAELMCGWWEVCVFRYFNYNQILRREIFTQSIFAHSRSAPFDLARYFLEFIKHTFTATGKHTEQQSRSTFNGNYNNNNNSNNKH